MSDVDLKKRRLLQLAGIWGTLGVVGAASPFFSSLFPSRASRMQAMPVKIDLSSMQLGDQKTIMWKGKPIWVIKRSSTVVSSLKNPNYALRDPSSQQDQQPDYAKNYYHSIHPDYLVLVGLCTHLGCAPTYRPEKDSVEKDWPGGFFCSCHGSKFDLAGRVFTGVPAPTNLVVPPHYYVDEQTLVVGAGHPDE